MDIIKIKSNEIQLFEGDFENVFTQLKDKSVSNNESKLGLQIITHIPYGLPSKGKIMSEETNSLLKRFGKMIKKNKEDFTDVFLLTASQSRSTVESCTKLEWKPVLQFQNCGIRVVLLKWNKI